MVQLCSKVPQKNVNVIFRKVWKRNVCLREADVLFFGLDKDGLPVTLNFIFHKVTV